MTSYGPEYYAARRMSRGNEEHVPRTLAKLRRVVELGPGTRVLEVGCGLGTITRPVAAGVAHVTAMDVSAHALAQARAAGAPANVEFVEADALAFRTRARFDVVLAMAVFEHFDAGEQGSFLGRARGWLAPGGRLVLHVPITRSWSAGRRKKRRGVEGPDYTGDPTHRATFSVRSFRAAVRGGGFRIEKEWIRYSRWGWPEGWSLAAMKAMPAALREKFAMEALVAAVAEGPA
ncbi:MAG: methyltransferase domain-containing protein [Planctomycetes bacterium]|nr:methyltransferase domain-containing protein [Planctomycetota bacterium]